MKHVLDTNWLPDETKEQFKLKTIKGGYLLYSGVLLPRELRPFRSSDFSYPRWIEDEMNAHVSFMDTTAQVYKDSPTMDKFLEKFENSFNNGSAGFYVQTPRNFDDKTAILSGLNEIVHGDDTIQSKQKILIVTSRSGIAQWRTLLRGFGQLLTFARILVIEYNQLEKLIEMPPVARIAQSRATKTRSLSLNGVANVNWDFVVFDKYHQTFGEHPSNFTYRMAIVAQLTKQYVKGKTPFVTFLSKKVLERPLDAMLLSQLFSTSDDSSRSTRIYGLQDFITQNKLSMVETDKGWAWLGEKLPRGSKLKAPDPKVQEIASRLDRATLNRIFGNSDNAFVLNFPQLSEPFFQAFPVTPKGTAKQHYMADWTQCRQQINSGKNLNDAVETFVKKSNLTKEEIVVKWVMEDLAPFGSVLVLATNVVGARSYDDAIHKINPEADDIEATTFEELSRNKIVMNFDTVVIESVGSVPGSSKVIHEKLKPTYIIVPYIENSLEENYVEKIIVDNAMATRMTHFETFIKQHAAKTPKPNRLS